MVEEIYYKNWLKEYYPFDHEQDLDLLYKKFKECYERGYIKGRQKGYNQGYKDCEWISKHDYFNRIN